MILINTGIHHQWAEFIVAFGFGFASFVGVAIVMGLGYVAESINDKLVELLVS